MLTLSDINKWNKEGCRILFILTEEDAQMMAKERIGRELTDDEMRVVSKGIEFGLECWGEVMDCAIDNAVDRE